MSVNKKTYSLTNLTIGSKVFVVHKSYAFSKKAGGKVLPAKIVSFVNVAGVVQPELKIVGHSAIVGESNYIIFTDIKKAIGAIKS